MMGWIKNRLTERTSLDGAMLVGLGVVMLLMPIDLAAYAAIVYGTWTMIKSGQNSTFYIARRFFGVQDAYVSNILLKDQTQS